MNTQPALSTRDNLAFMLRIQAAYELPNALLTDDFVYSVLRFEDRFCKVYGLAVGASIKNAFELWVMRAIIYDRVHTDPSALSLICGQIATVGNLNFEAVRKLILEAVENLPSSYENQERIA